jgi:hypothetical protein
MVCAAACASSAGTAGCYAPRAASGAAGASVGLETIIEHSLDAHRRLRTLHATGVVFDDRAGDRRFIPIAWHCSRPGRYRLQFGQDLVLVLGDRSWTWHAAESRFRSYRPFTRTPLETAASLVSGGIPLYTAVLLGRPEAFFLTPSARAHDAWRLLGADWAAGRPCYVLTRPTTLLGRAGRLRVWIDQDAWLVCGWDIVFTTPEGEEEVVLACQFDEAVANAPLAADAFQLRPPAPIERPRAVRPRGPVGRHERGRRPEEK